ncbi:MAG: SpaA isopeptide-forming pilin-related protein [Clostridia bacterium]|nr:SpaA isopeptide-forming pilin-related protein [Clostridia bacterium]
MRTKRLKRFKRSKIDVILLMLLLMASFVMPLSPSQPVFAGVPDPQAGFRISDAKITLNGTPIDAVTTPIAQNATVRLQYTWSIADTDFIEEGDEISVNLPDALNLGDSNRTGTLIGPGSVSFGSWLLNATERKLILTLSNVPKDLSNVYGTVEFQLNFRINTMLVDVPYHMIIPLSGTDAKTYDIVFSVPGMTALAKSGIQSPSDANVLTWTLDINRDLKSVTSPVVSDTIDSRLDYMAGSMKVYSLAVKSDGTVAQGALLDASNYSVNYNASSKQLTVSFNSPINLAYRLVYDTSIDPAQVDTSKTSFTYSNNASFNSVARTASVTVVRGPLIIKSAQGDRAYNANKIKWSIGINKSNYPLITNAKVEDNIPAGLTLDTDSLKVYKMPGAVAVTPSAYTVSFASGNTGFTLELGDITQEYLVEYETSVNESEKKNNSVSMSFTNNAKLYQGPEGSVKMNSTQSAISLAKGQAIRKSGTAIIGYNDEKYINWTLDVNLSEIDLGTSLITDVISPTGKHKLDIAEGVKVYPLTIDHTKTSNNITEGALLTEGTDYSLSMGSDPVNEFTIAFPSNIQQAYRLKYRTIITDKNTQTFTNKGFVGPNGGTPNVTASVTPTISNTYTKTSTSVNYSTKVFGWRLNVNPVQQAINNLVITDTLSAGLMMTEAQFDAITVVKGSATLVRDTDYTLTQTMSGGKIKGFVISFADKGHVVNNNEYIITYNTTIDPDELSNNGSLNYANTAVFSHSGGTVTRNVSPTINNPAKYNGSKSGVLDAANKRLNWTIDTNYLSKNINNLELTDTMLGNQKLVPGSIKIYNYSVASNGSISEGSQVDASAEGFVIEEYAGGTGFKITYPASINKPYRIKYASEFTGISQTVYSNTAATNVNESYSANVNHPDGDKFVSKTGTRVGTSHINWSVTINKSQSTINSFTLTDRLSEGLKLVEDSFVVKNTSGTALNFNDMFTLNVRPRTLVTDPQIFDLVSKVPIDRTYTIEYRTDLILDEILENKVFNNVSFSGEQVVSGVTQSAITITHAFVTGSGTGTGEVGSIKLKKTNEAGQPLQGAKFEFYKGAKLLGLLVTDSNGEATVNRLKYAAYLLKEIEAPAGYQITSQNTSVTINSTVQQVITIKNDSLRTLEIIKSEAGKPETYLSNAVFEIRDSANTLLHTIATNSEGKAQVDLPYGVYKVVEKTAPVGYIKDSSEHTVSISPTDLMPDGVTPKTKYSIKVENARLPEPLEKEKDKEPSPAPAQKTAPAPSPEPVKEKEQVKTLEKKTVDGEVKLSEGSKPEIIKQPENGKVELDPSGKWKYTPNEGFVGKDSFVIEIKDEEGNTKEVYIDILVEEVPLAPAKVPSGATLPKTGEDSPLLIYASGFALLCAGIFILYMRRKNQNAVKK